MKVAGTGLDRASDKQTISVIVPVYGVAAYLETCVQSLLAQTVRDFALEILLVDDGSKDGGGAVCDRLAAEDMRVRVIHKPNEGLVATWIRGVRESTGAYLCFVDGDDWVDPDMLEQMSARLLGASREIVCAGYRIERMWNGSSEIRENRAAEGEYTGQKLREALQSRLLGSEDRVLILSRCMKLFSRSLIEDNLHYCDPRIRMGEDVSITVPAILDAERVFVMNSPFYHYRFVRDSMVHRYDPGMLGNIRLLSDIIRRVMEDKAVPDGAAQAEKEFACLFLLVLKNEIRRTDLPTREVIEEIRGLCFKERSDRLLAQIGGFRERKDMAGRLLALVMRRPGRLRVRLIRRIFLWQQGAASR